jgi:Spy/CpxP family protein refolding chaperone
LRKFLRSVFMKKFKKIAVLGAAVLVVSAMSVTALAASSYSTPAEAVAGLTGKTVEAVTQERTETGKSYGAIANDAGKLSEFQSEMLEIRKDRLNERVEAGQITQERADELMAAMEDRQANCDGTGSGAGQGLHMGGNEGKGHGQNNGHGGSGMKLGNGTGICQADNA